MTINKTNSWILEKPVNSWKIQEKIWSSETLFISGFLSIPDLIFNSIHPTILLDMSCLAKPKWNIYIYFFVLENKHIKPVLGVISVKK